MSLLKLYLLKHSVKNTSV